jgi:hypothetical protein
MSARIAVARPERVCVPGVVGAVGGIPFRTLCARGALALRAPGRIRRAAAQGSPSVSLHASSLSGGDAQAARSHSSRDVQDSPLPLSFPRRQLVDPRSRVGDEVPTPQHARLGCV